MLCLFSSTRVLVLIMSVTLLGRGAGRRGGVGVLLGRQDSGSYLGRGNLKINARSPALIPRSFKSEPEFHSLIASNPIRTYSWVALQCSISAQSTQRQSRSEKAADRSSYKDERHMSAVLIWDPDDHRNGVRRASWRFPIYHWVNFRPDPRDHSSHYSPVLHSDTKESPAWTYTSSMVWITLCHGW